MLGRIKNMITDFAIRAIQPVTNTHIVIKWERNLESSYVFFCKGFFYNTNHESFLEIPFATDDDEFVISGCRANSLVQIYGKEIKNNGQELFSNSLRVKNAPDKPELSLLETFYNSARFNIAVNGATSVLLYNEARNLIRSFDKTILDGQDNLIFEISDLSMATQYSFFAVTSSNENSIENLSEQSNLLSFSTFLAPQTTDDLVFTSITDSSCVVSWTPQAGALSYKVILEGEVLLHTTETQMILQNLLPNKRYNIRIASVGAAGDLLSEVFSFTTKLAPLSELRIVDVGSNFIKIESEPVDGATSYNFYENLEFAGSSVFPKFTFNGLNAGQTYKLTAAATKNGIETSAVFITAATYVSPPDNIRITSITANSISLDWTGILGASGYRVYVVDGVNESYFETTSTSVTVAHIASVSEYLFQVTAIKNSIESEKSGILSATTLPPILATPASLRIETKTSNSIVLAWNKVYDYGRPLLYHIYLNRVLYATTTALSFTINGLMANVTYMFSVTAKNISGESEPTPNLYIKTLAELIAPTNVIATALSEANIAITWSEVARASEYVVIINGREYSSTTASFVKTDAVKNTDYSIQVYAKNATGQSNLSSVVIVRTPTGNPDAPKNLIATPYSYSFELAWDNVSDAYAYHVFIDGAEFKTASNNVVIIEKDPNTTYRVEVHAVALYGTSLASTLFVKTKLGSPQNLRLLMSTENELELAWDKVEQASYYRLVKITSLLSTEDDLNGISIIEAPIPITGVNTSYLKKLKSNTLYEYAIYAIDANGAISDRSEILEAYTVADVSSAPNNIRAAIVQDTSFQVMWNRVPDALLYNVYLNDEFYNPVESPIDFMDIVDLTPGTQYKLQMSSVGIDGESSLSNPMTVITKTSKPENITVSRLDNIAMLTWNAVNNVLAYKIYYKTDPAATNYLGISLVLNRTNFIQNSPIMASASVYSSYGDTGRHGIELTGFLPNTAYWFAVSAIGKDGKESKLVQCKDNFTWSAPVILTAAPQRTAPGLIYNRTNNSITIKWSV